MTCIGIRMLYTGILTGLSLRNGIHPLGEPRSYVQSILGSVSISGVEDLRTEYAQCEGRFNYVGDIFPSVFNPSTLLDIDEIFV